MPNTPLNPDALEAAAKATMGIVYGKLPAEEMHVAVARAAVSAYLAAAQSVVNSVEELDALPHGTVIFNSLDEAVSKYGDDWYFPGIKHRFATVVSLPARVLYLPEVPGA
ncbi:hypothetical protein [Glutamicibacter sp. BW77]|uniref:hypothetical protein n=1 Tax=Glutamicibacter sp. BW77 TaxID=2024402 RepID=UPI000BB6FE27|nr:hypothetical protein [Glutamicibacter sp. BW77]PCC31412.1 hypothetical protein CIK74_17205 [Glutamicibacter sp. BW77]